MSKTLNFQIILSAVDRMSSAVGNAVSKSQQHLQRLEKSAGFKSFDKAGTNALLAGGAMTAGLGMAVRAAEESATAQARLNQVFRSMGETTGRAAQQAKEYASALSLQIAVDDEAIMLTQAKLATFAQVSNETARMNGIFDRATRAAHDLAAAGFGDAAGNAVQLGKALQDPIKGITAMTRSGVTFTKEEQAKIKALTESGRILEAQKVILQAVETQVGGVAAATANDTDKMKIAFGEMVETVGAVLLPVVKVMTDFMVNDFLPAFQVFIDQHPGVVKAIALIAGGLLAFGIAAKTVTGVVKTMNVILALNPIVLVAMAIVAAAIAIIYYWENIKAYFSSFWNWIKTASRIALTAFMPWIWLPKLFPKAWDATKTYFAGWWNWFKGGWDAMIDYIYSIPGKMWDAGVNIVTSIWEGMKSAWNGMIDWFAGGLQLMRDMLPFSPAKRGPLTDIHRLKFVETISSSIKPTKLADTMSKTARVAKSAFMASAAAPVIAGGGNTTISSRTSGMGVNITYSPVITLTGVSSSDRESFSQLLRKHQDELVRMLRDVAAREQRKSFA